MDEAAGPKRRTAVIVLAALLAFLAAGIAWVLWSASGEQHEPTSTRAADTAPSPLVADAAPPAPPPTDEPPAIRDERTGSLRAIVSGPRGPVQGASVRVVAWSAWLARLPSTPEPQAIAFATTDRRGAFRVDGIPRDTACGLVVDADGFVSVTERVGTYPDPDSIARFDVTLGAARDVLGTVNDEHGLAAAGAAPVTWRGTVADDLGRRVAGATVTAGDATTRTNSDGVFELDLDPEWRRLDVTAPGMARESVPIRNSGAPIAVSLRRRAPLRVKFELPSGVPVPSWHRVWDLHAPRKASDLPWEDRSGWNGGGVVFDDWDPTHTSLEVLVPGCEPAILVVTSSAGSTTELGTFALKRAPQRRGVVVTETGDPVPYAEVLLELLGTPAGFLGERSVLCDSIGRFTIDAPAAARHCEFVVTADHHATTPQRCLDTTDVQRVVIGKDRTHRGRFAQEAERSISGVARLLGRWDEVYAIVPVAQDGTYEATVPLEPHRVVFAPGR